jgi:hypothetical protein
VIETLDGADEHPDWNVSGAAMRWRPYRAPERTWNPGDPLVLPPVPESCYPRDAVRLDVQFDFTDFRAAIHQLGEQLTWFFDEPDQDRRRGRLRSAMRRAYRRRRGGRW